MRSQGWGDEREIVGQGTLTKVEKTEESVDRNWGCPGTVSPGRGICPGIAVVSRRQISGKAQFINRKPYRDDRKPASSHARRKNGD